MLPYVIMKWTSIFLQFVKPNMSTTNTIVNLDKLPFIIGYGYIMTEHDT